MYARKSKADMPCLICRAVVCFERQVVAQCNNVAPRQCTVYLASDSAAVCHQSLESWRKAGSVA